MNLSELNEYVSYIKNKKKRKGILTLKINNEVLYNTNNI